LSGFGDADVATGSIVGMTKFPVGGVGVATSLLELHPNTKTIKHMVIIPHMLIMVGVWITLYVGTKGGGEAPSLSSMLFVTQRV